MGLQECQRKLTSSEFVECKVRLEMSVNDFHREDYFSAQIAFTYLLANVKDPDKLKFEDFLLQFIDPAEKEKVDKEQRMQTSMRAWGAHFGMVIDPNPSGALQEDEQSGSE